VIQLESPLLAKKNSPIKAIAINNQENDFEEQKIIEPAKHSHSKEHHVTKNDTLMLDPAKFALNVHEQKS